MSTNKHWPHHDVLHGLFRCPLLSSILLHFFFRPINAPFPLQCKSHVFDRVTGLMPYVVDLPVSDRVRISTRDMILIYPT